MRPTSRANKRGLSLTSSRLVSSHYKTPIGSYSVSASETKRLMASEDAGNSVEAFHMMAMDEANQAEFKFPDPHVAYKIMPAEQDKMALDITSLDIPEKKLVKNNVIIWDYHGGPNQQFYLKKISKKDDRYYILSESTGFALEVPNESRDNDVQVHVNPRGMSLGEIWTLEECGKDLYKLRSFCGKVLDVQHDWLRNGNPVVQFEDNGGKNQKWKIWPA